MVRNLVLLSGSSHPSFVDAVATSLGIAPSNRLLAKFASGETRCEIRDSVRGKDVYIVQSFGCGDHGVGLGHRNGEDEDEAEDEAEKKHGPHAAPREKQHTVNDYFIELCIMISACKTGSARRVTAVLPLFPYSRQPDLPFSKVGAPLVGMGPPPGGGENGGAERGGGDAQGKTGTAKYTFESVPVTPGPHVPRTSGLGAPGFEMIDMFSTLRVPSAARVGGGSSGWATPALGLPPAPQQYTTHDYENPSLAMALQAGSGHKQFMAQAGSLVADLLTCAGADRVLTCDLHESAYQGFFDIPVDNLYARPLLKEYIERRIPSYRDAVIVSPDAGGAKRAIAIADSLGLNFALIHKERRHTNVNCPPKATMMLVGDVAGRTCILVDDLVDTANTITRAAKLLKREGRATGVVALLTHGVLSGDAIARINASALDRVVVTNTVAQSAVRRAACPKLEVLDVSATFAEAIRRVHHGESVSRLFQYD
ncbi:phosphoribosyltransferase-like protein [Dichotomopilus funicola]|uniref:ribose-phosphate diphosphokinase n=1 Tax=Dichotomopilus funicola TaxID=1934379 RepID=A0AAN6ZQH6_9PEZI|nr:phosphoribosyltransferase-like protein [Dichotomopilus funicola]